MVGGEVNGRDPSRPEMRRGESHFLRVGELYVQGRIQSYDRREGAFDYPF